MAETATPAKRAAGGTKRGSAAAETAKPSSRSLRLHHLKPAEGANKNKIRKGRGEASKGKTSGRGTKGTKARKTVSPRFEGGQMPLHMRLPKLKGFSNPFRVSYEVVNLDKLVELFPSGGEVGPAELVAAGVARPKRRIKVLGDGELGKVALNVTAHKFSGSAREKITAAGGTANEL